MRILRALGGRLLPCGCLVGTYETYGGATVWMVDAVAPDCDLPAHRANAILAPIEPASTGVSSTQKHP
jgi:hypothetical protein